MTDSEKQAFAALCAAECASVPTGADGIGTYNEKRLHRILKRFITEDEACHEVKIGRYVADVLCENRIFEIQTGSFASLADKLRFYLENGEYTVTVIYPIICEKRLIRADKDTGEVIRSSRSPKHGRPSDALTQLYFIRNLIPNGRLCVRVLHIAADEYRFSEARRYSRKGRYDNDLKPTALLDETVIRGLDDVRALVPPELFGKEFTPSDFESATGLRGRNRYYALAALCGLGTAEKRTEGRRLFYRMKD